MLGDIKNFVLPHILYEKIVCQQTDIQTIFLFLENLWLEFQMFSGLFFSFGKWFKRNHDFLTKIRLWPDHERRRGKFGTKILEQKNEMNLGNSKIQEKLNIECGCCLKLYLKNGWGMLNFDVISVVLYFLQNNFFFLNFCSLLVQNPQQFLLC